MGSAADFPKIDFTVRSTPPLVADENSSLTDNDDWQSNFQNIINNALSSTPETRQAVDPSTEELLYHVPLSKQADVDKAVSVAKAAFPAWKALSYDERAGHLGRYADAIEANVSGLQELLMKEAGKPVSNAAGELQFAIAHVRETAKLRIEDDLIEDTEEVGLVCMLICQRGR